jgi:YjjG family noncanonical pyrimidine nucleotidase
MKNTIKHIFFDLDHTLWDFEKNSELTFRMVLQKHKIDVDFDKFIKFYIPINAKYWEMFRKDEISQNQLRHGRLKETFDLIGYQINNELIDLISDDYIDNLPKFNHLFEGTIEILDYLKINYHLHIITNGFEEVQNHKINNSGIATYFQTITNSEKSGAKKPNPIIFNHALELAKATKQNSVMIGDCIEADVKGALDFGMSAIYFNEHQKIVSSDFVQISHLLELKKYL